MANAALLSPVSVHTCSRSHWHAGSNNIHSCWLWQNGPKKQSCTRNCCMLEVSWRTDSGVYAPGPKLNGALLLYWLTARLPASTTDITADRFSFFLDRFVFNLFYDLPKKDRFVLCNGLWPVCWVFRNWPMFSLGAEKQVKDNKCIYYWWVAEFSIKLLIQDEIFGSDTACNTIWLFSWLKKLMF